MVKIFIVACAAYLTVICTGSQLLEGCQGREDLFVVSRVLEFTPDIIKVATDQVVIVQAA